MKRSIKIFAIICGILVLLLFIFPQNPIRWAYEKHLLLSDDVLSKLQIQDNCNYQEGQIFAGDSSAHGPSIGCLTKGYFSHDEQKIEVAKMSKILQENGWVLSAAYNDWDITYHKGGLEIRIQSYWIPEFKDQLGSNYQLIIEYYPL